MDDDRAVFVALTSFHAIHGRELGLSLKIWLHAEDC